LIRDPNTPPGDVRTETLRIGASRIGGVPDLPPGWEWPILADGFVVSDNERRPGYAGFLLQIALADIPAFPGNPLPRAGFLYVYELGPSRPTSHSYQVLYSDARSVELVRADRPKGMACAAEPAFFELSESTPLECTLGFDLPIRAATQGELIAAISRVTRKDEIDADLLDNFFAFVAAGRAAYRDSVDSEELPDSWLQAGRLFGALQVDSNELPGSPADRWRPLLTIMSNAAVDYFTPFDARDMQLLVPARGQETWTDLCDVVSAVVG
jgi:hypothetical protein